jgi:AraC-like DNA-binding protein
MRQRLTGLAAAGGDCWLFRDRQGLARTHRHDELELNLVIRGRVTYLVGEQRLDLRRHHLLWLHPSEEHLLVHASSDVAMWIVVLRQEVLHRITSRATAAALTAPRPTAGCLSSLAAAHTRSIDRLLDDLQGWRQPGPAGDHDCFLTGLIHAVVLAWEAHLVAGQADASPDVHPAVDRVARLLAAGDDRSVAALAHVVGMHPDTLSRRFHRDLGLRLADHRNRCRIERFLEAAIHQRQPVLDAALGAGFGSYPQFHRVFRALMGCSARDYLKSRADETD